MAGLLTDSHLEAFPAKASGNEVFQDVIGASQQRDGPGFSPDSLLIFTKNIRFRTDFNRKDILFFINGKPNTFFLSLLAKKLLMIAEKTCDILHKYWPFSQELSMLIPKIIPK